MKSSFASTFFICVSLLKIFILMEMKAWKSGSKMVATCGWSVAMCPLATVFGVTGLVAFSMLGSTAEVSIRARLVELLALDAVWGVAMMLLWLLLMVLLALLMEVVGSFDVANLT
jgi:hypothetical protein